MSSFTVYFHPYFINKIVIFYRFHTLHIKLRKNAKQNYLFPIEKLYEIVYHSAYSS